MHRLLILILMMVSINFSHAQKGIYFKTSGGISFPFLELASKSWNTELSSGGFALPGFCAGFTGQLMFSNTIGISFSSQVNSFTMDGHSIEKQSLNAQTDSMVRAETGAWNFRFIAAGPIVKYSFSEKWTLDFSLVASYMKSRFPYLRRIVTNKQGIPSTFIRETPTAKSMVFSGEVGINRYLDEHLMLSLAAEALFTRPVFKFSDNTTKSYSSLTLGPTVGLIYKF